MKIILGSASPRRAEVLQEMGFEFEIVKADFDEKSVRSDNPKELSLTLAKAKADDIKKKLGQRDALLITADQVVFCNGQIREKPTSTAEAIRYLKSYGDYPTQCVNGLCVTNLKSGRQAAANHIAVVYFKPIPADIIEKLILDKVIFDCAGGIYLRHPLLKTFIDKIEGGEDSALGLPKDLLLELIEKVE